MDKTCIDILNKWAEYINYDADQKSFTISLSDRFELRNFQYETNKATKMIEHITEEYDESGILAVEVVKNTLTELLKDSKMTAYDVITNPAGLKEHIDMFNAFNSKEIIEAENIFIDKVNTLISQLTDKKLLGTGNDNKSKIFEYIDLTIKSLDSCKIESYKKGGTIGEITKVSKSIHIFPTLAECVLTLNNAEDGLYLCYIDIMHSADSYFGFFIKSNGNLFSVNDRVDETFKSQHCHSRNGRWTESKSNIFPYGFIFSFADADYKGYYHSYVIDEEKLSIFNLEEEAYMPILMAIILLIRRYKGKTVERETVYIDSLLPVNIGLLENKKNELMINTSNDLIERHNMMNLNFDTEKILDGSIFDEFDDEKLNYNEYITTLNNGQIFVDLYGEGFHYTPDILSSDKMITAGENGEYIPEFIGSETRLRAQALMEIRMQLAEYIRQNMYEEYLNYGGITKVRKWFTTAVRNNISKFEAIIAEKHFATLKKMQEYNETHTEQREYHKFFTNGNWRPSECEDNYFISCVEDTYLTYEYAGAYLVNDKQEYKYKYNDMRTGATCSRFYVIRPINYKGLQLLFGDIPKIVKGWKEDGHHISCNLHLDMHDPVESIGTPFERNVCDYVEPYKSMYRNERPLCNFSFAIGYSKRGFKQMLKENNRENNK